MFHTATSSDVLEIEVGVYTASSVDEALRSSTVGTCIEAPCQRNGVWEGVSLSPLGRGLKRGLCPIPEKSFAFGSQNGEIWCILGRIFTVELLTLTHTHTQLFTARRLAKRGICRRRVSVCVCVCHTPILYQNG